MGIDGLCCAVTGGSGFVGRRLVELLLLRGAKKVISFDIVEIDKKREFDFLSDDLRNKIKYVCGDLKKYEDVLKAFRGCDCVWHVGALVGPYHKKTAYYDVNYIGTLNVIRACKQLSISKLIGSSSPSTRFDGNHINGLSVEDLQIRPTGKFLEKYAETKAKGEIALLNSCTDTFFTVAIAPHQVYGPRDSLFLPNLLYAGVSGKLRIFGKGDNKVAFTHVDNYCHALIIAYDQLYKDSPILGKFYIVTDGSFQYFWKVIDEACVFVGANSLFEKFHLPVFLLIFIAYLLKCVSFFTGQSFRLTPFTVKMMTINRWFDIKAAENDLHYKPIISFSQGWKDTLVWFKNHKEWWIQCAENSLK